MRVKFALLNKLRKFFVRKGNHDSWAEAQIKQMAKLGGKLVL